ncbi:MAG: NAD(P)H-dependent oxidoreductase, partial [Phycisphaerales bacterium]|nr:NAD(P)H-dependent oxidoreductase [Phycisphaerales bacterium]
MTVRILGFAGSTRKASFHKKLVQIALEAANQAGAETEYLDLQELDIPLYCGDLETEHGLPPAARTFREQLTAADGLLIASP